eukprot:117893_1
MAERAQIDKGLKHLSGSEEIIGNIVAYCVNAHKADPSAQTMDKIRQYVADTANSVCGHVLTIAHNINSIIDKESKEIEEMSFQVSYVAHRIKSHQTYMSQLYMTKFQTLPRPRPVVHILRETIPTDKLPKYAKPKKPWIRQPIFDYSILDQVGSGKKRKPVSSQAIEGKVEKEYERKQNALKQIQPKAAVQAFNPYANVMKNDNAQPKAKKAPVVAKKIVAAPISSNKSLYQQEKEAKLKKSMKQNVGPAPPSFSAAAPPSFSGAAPPSFSAAGKQPKGPPAVPKAAKGPPPVPGGPPAPPGMGGPPPVPR